MSTPKMDGAGLAKMETLESAVATMQTIHGIVEQMAIGVKNGASTAPYIQRLRRTASPLVGLLKGQFGMISDGVAAMVLSATRGSNDQTRLRILRESVASVKVHLEIAQKRVLEAHMVTDDEGKAPI